MRFLQEFVHRPRKVWLRRLSFQIHLWAGLLLTLYLIAIGATGSILVFREELESLAGRNAWPHLHAGVPAEPAAVLSGLERAFPRARVVSLAAPTRSTPMYVAVLRGRGRYFGEAGVAIDPVTSQVLGRLRPELRWLQVVRNFHETLLAGRVGREVNGVLAACLLLINITGIVIWWPGIRRWTRALRIDPARGWRRMNFDVHRAAGFWTLGIVSFWAISGIYFAWSGEIRGIVNRISPLISASPPAIRVEPRAETPAADIGFMLSEAARLDPGTALRTILFPSGRRAPLEISMQRAGTGGAEFADTLYFDPRDGRCLGIWKYGVNQSLGDWVVWSQIPLHFGTFWGLGMKIAWAALGFSISLLAVTGALMYWNRFLRRRWRRVRARSA